ncbi:hypothetical protein CBOM_00143 [Ceraceosorus bombacis]|uniref:Uncharacterized protein n=1 Tax=Ceraceosorus bombacis TaxID=401625 RepID=A0A0N7L8W7_9BASI|nr:hypothetical protein CBOM_00143 [Ceraceosorus bombacis]
MPSGVHPGNGGCIQETGDGSALSIPVCAPVARTLVICYTRDCRRTSKHVWRAIRRALSPISRAVFSPPLLPTFSLILIIPHNSFRAGLGFDSRNASSISQEPTGYHLLTSSSSSLPTRFTHDNSSIEIVQAIVNTTRSTALKTCKMSVQYGQHVVDHLSVSLYSFTFLNDLGPNQQQDNQSATTSVAQDPVHNAKIANAPTPITEDQRTLMRDVAAHVKIDPRYHAFIRSMLPSESYFWTYVNSYHEAQPRGGLRTILALPWRAVGLVSGPKSIQSAVDRMEHQYMRIGQALVQMSERQFAFESPAIGALFQANERRKADIGEQYATRCKAFAERLELCAQEAHDLREFEAAKERLLRLVRSEADESLICAAAQAKSAIRGRLEANQRNLYFTKAIAPASAALMPLPSAALTELDDEQEVASADDSGVEGLVSEDDCGVEGLVSEDDCGIERSVKRRTDD